MKRPIAIVGFVILVLVLGLGATMVAVGGMFRLGKSLLPRQSGALALVLSFLLAILVSKGTSVLRRHSMRKATERGAPEPTESERRAVRFCVRATLATISIFVVLLGVLHKW